MKSPSLYRYFLAGSSTIILCAIVLGSVLIWRDFQEWRHHRLNLSNLELFHAAINAAQTIAAEDVTDQAVLSASEPGNSLLMQTLAEQRERSKATIDILARLIARQKPAQQAVFNRTFGNAQSALAHSRESVDLLAQQPLAARKREDITKTVDMAHEAMIAVISVVFSSHDQLITEDPRMAGPANLLLMASRLRHETVRLAVSWIVPLEDSRALTETEKKNVSQLMGKVELLHQLIRSQASLYLNNAGTPEEQEKLAAKLIASATPTLSRLLQESSGKVNYFISAPQFSEIIRQDGAAQTEVCNLIIGVSQRQATETGRKANLNMIFSALITLFIVSVLVVMLLAARRNFFAPLLHARAEIIRLADGDTQSPAGKAPVGSEMRSLFAALETLRHHAVELRETHRQLRQIGDNLPNGAIYELQETADGKFRYLYISKGVERLVGLTAQEVIDDPSNLSRMLFTEDMPQLRIEEQKARVNGSPFDFTLRHRRRDGRIVWVQSRSAPRPGPDGSILWDGVMIDVTTQKQVEEQTRLLEQANHELIASRAFQEATGRMARVGGWEYDPATGTGRWSEEIFNILEIPLNEKSSFTYDPLFFSDASRPVFQAALERCSVDGTPWDLDLEMVTAKGRHVWVRMIGAAEMKNGRPHILRGALQETTDRKRMEEKLREEHNLLRTLIDHLPMVTFITDRDDRLLAYNTVLLDAWKLPRDSNIIGQTVTQHMPGPRAAKLNAESAAVMETGQPILNHVEFVDMPGGDHVWRRTSKIPWRDGQGKIVGLVCLTADITEEQLVQQKLKDQSAMLQEANTALQEAVTRAEHLAQSAQASEQAKGEFIAVMSHEIRTPLNAILGMATLLQTSGTFTTEQREYLETIRSSGEAMTDLIADILDHSKLEANAMKLEQTSCDLVELATTCLGLIAERAKTKGIMLGLEVVQPFPARFVADSGRIRQVLLNLLTNAVKFTDAGEIIVRFATGAIEDGRQLVTLSVRDTGIGMTAEQQAQLFRPFSQGDASITRRYGGTGLGLSISKRLALLMHGDITVQSEAGHGSEFTCVLRLSAEEGSKPAMGSRIVVFSRRATVATTLTSILRHLGAEPIVMAHEQISERPSAAAAIIDHDLGEEAMRIREAMPGLPCYLLVPRERSTAHASEAGFIGLISHPPGVDFLRDLLGGTSPGNPRGFIFDPAMAGRHPLRLLIADDNAVNQRVLLLMLKRMGYQADAAANGREAVDAWKRQTYDLIFMDCHMPELDGFSATQEIRRLERTKKQKHTHIIALTADAREEVWKACLSSGMDGYLSKPINPASLNNALSGFQSGVFPQG